MQHALDTLRPYWPMLMALVGYPLITAALNWWLWWDTPEHWDAFVARQPRAAVAVRILRAVGPHLRKVVVAYRDWAAARGVLPRPTLDAVANRADEVPRSRPEAPAPVSPLRAVTVSHQPPPPASADPLLDAARASVGAELGELMPSPPPANGQRGSIGVRALLAVVVALAVALPLGVVVAGCPRMPPVSGCSPMAQTCIADSPHVCSASQRWHRAGALTCAEVGGSCAVVGGRAYCAAPVVDAGAADAADGGL